MNENLMLVGIAIFYGFAIIWGLGFPLKFFVALRSPPGSRAAIMIGVAYVIATLFFVFGMSLDGYEYLAPVTNIPGAALAFWMWHRAFKSVWFDDVDLMPDGIERASDDWKEGLLKLAAIIILASIAAGIKWVLRH